VAALGGTHTQVSAAPRLNAILERRIATNMPSSTSSPAPLYARAVSMPRQMPSVSPISVPQPRPTALSCNESCSPRSMTSTTNTPPSTAHFPTYYATPLFQPTAEIKSEDCQYDYSYGEPHNSPWTYTSEQHYSAQPSTYYCISSCADAANMIRTMRSDIGPELEADLGCRDPHQQCYVDNATIFDIMEKYSSNHGTT
jgi:hypothetical protein